MLKQNDVVSKCRISFAMTLLVKKKKLFYPSYLLASLAQTRSTHTVPQNNKGAVKKRNSEKSHK